MPEGRDGVAAVARRLTGGVEHATVRDKPLDLPCGGRGLACGKPAGAGTLLGMPAGPCEQAVRM